jgi:hypothetical protein
VKELLDDVTKALLEDPRLEYVRKGGGVFALRDLAEFPYQVKTPCIVLVGLGAAGVLHWSSARRWMPFSLELHVVHRHFQKIEAVVGSEFDEGVEQMAKDVRHVLDMNRMGGKYVRMFLTSEGATALISAGNIFLLEKALTFEVVRLE